VVELTREMQQAMQEATATARRYLLAEYPRESEHLLCALLAGGFADMLRNGHPAAQAALATATNYALAGSPWRVVRGEDA
jgi:hypothetical protein